MIYRCKNKEWLVSWRMTGEVPCLRFTEFEILTTTPSHITSKFTAFSSPRSTYDSLSRQFIRDGAFQFLWFRAPSCSTPNQLTKFQFKPDTLPQVHLFEVQFEAYQSHLCNLTSLTSKMYPLTFLIFALSFIFVSASPLPALTSPWVVLFHFSSLLYISFLSPWLSLSWCFPDHLPSKDAPSAPFVSTTALVFSIVHASKATYFIRPAANVGIPPNPSTTLLSPPTALAQKLESRSSLSPTAMAIRLCIILMRDTQHQDSSAAFKVCGSCQCRLRMMLVKSREMRFCLVLRGEICERRVRKWHLVIDLWRQKRTRLLPSLRMILHLFLGMLPIFPISSASALILTSPRSSPLQARNEWCTFIFNNLVKGAWGGPAMLKFNDFDDAGGHCHPLNGLYATISMENCYGSLTRTFYPLCWSSMNMANMLANRCDGLQRLQLQFWIRWGNILHSKQRLGRAIFWDWIDHVGLRDRSPEVGRLGWFEESEGFRAGDEGTSVIRAWFVVRVCQRASHTRIRWE